MSEVPVERDSFSSLKNRERVQYHLSADTPPPKKGLFSLLIRRIKKTFNPVKDEEGKLYGRVQQLHRTAGAVLLKLKNIRELLKVSIDEELFGYVSALMEPMTRDFACIEKLLMEKGSVIAQAKAFKKYSNWMLKAELWLSLEKKIHNMDLIQEAIIKHIMHETDERIDQDLQVIRDYQDYILESLPLNDEEMRQLKKHVDKEVRYQLSNLEDLKDKPELDSFDSVLVWKDHVDKLRSKFFERALQVIDEMVGAVSPTSSSEEEHEHLVEVLTQVVFLEEQIPALIADVEDVEIIDKEKKRFVLSQINSFEQELHELNLNLRLTPEVVERIQTLTENLEIVSKKINQ